MLTESSESLGEAAPDTKLKNSKPNPTTRLNVGKGKYIELYYKSLCKSMYDIVGKSVGLIADAMTIRSSKNDINLLVYLETERLRAEERMRIQMKSEKRQKNVSVIERKTDAVMMRGFKCK